MIYLLSDHAGYSMKEKVARHLTKRKVTFTNLGVKEETSVSYSKLVKENAGKITKEDFGIFICGTGIGISIASNRFKHIRAALCYDVNSAKLARRHNNANVLALKGRKACALKTYAIVDAFLSEQYEGGRHEERVSLLTDMTE